MLVRAGRIVPGGGRGWQEGILGCGGAFLGGEGGMGEDQAQKMGEIGGASSHHILTSASRPGSPRSE